MSDYTIEQPADECPHGMFPATSCSICIEIEQRARHKQEDIIVAQWMARYEGHCADCHDPIEIGDIICRMGDSRIVCENCS